VDRAPVGLHDYRIVGERVRCGADPVTARYRPGSRKGAGGRAPLVEGERSVAIKVKVPESTRDDLASEAAANGLSLSAFVRLILQGSR
jgi:hypothetical protein